MASQRQPQSSQAPHPASDRTKSNGGRHAEQKQRRLVVRAVGAPRRVALTKAGSFGRVLRRFIPRRRGWVCVCVRAYARRRRMRPGSQRGAAGGAAAAAAERRSERYICFVHAVSSQVRAGHESGRHVRWPGRRRVPTARAVGPSRRAAQLRTISPHKATRVPVRGRSSHTDRR